MTGWLEVGASSRVGGGDEGRRKICPFCSQRSWASLPPTGRGVRSKGKRPEASKIHSIQLPEHSYILAENMNLERRVVGN